MDINTERLLLKPITHVYDEDIFNNFNEEIITYMYPSVNETLEKTANVVQKFMDNFALGEEYVFAITLKNTDEFIGLCGLHDLSNVSPELGIWTKKESHGNHYGREAIGGLIELARTNGYTKLIYPVDMRNISSKKIPLYYGGELIKNARKITTKDNRELLIETYEIIL